MVAQPGKYENIPIPNTVQAVVDFWRKENAISHRLCFRLARVRVPLEGYQLWHNFNLFGPSMVEGSVKSGIPIKRPKWTILDHDNWGITFGNNTLYMTTNWLKGTDGPTFPVMVMWDPAGLPSDYTALTPPLTFNQFPLVSAGSFNNCAQGRYPA